MKTIGLVAKELEINVETVRFYEREGLIEQPQKPRAGYRKYDQNLVDQIKFILNAKSLGFSLMEIKSFLKLSVNCEDIKNIGIRKIELIQQKIMNLKKLESAIVNLTKECSNNTDNSRCPIIDSLKNLDSVL